MWVRLVKKYDFQFLPEPAVLYRIRTGGLNLSAPNPAHLVRDANESYLVLRRFFEGVSPDFLREAFGDRFRRADAPAPRK